MNKDDIIRRFLMLHPETPIDMREYAVPLLIIKNLLENCMEYERKVEREACAKVAERFEPIEKQGYVEYASTAIRARGQG
jgi:hypothetical protein